MSPVLQRLWHSPTFTTWASFVVRAGSVAVVLPLAAVLLGKPEFLLWQLLVTVQTLVFMLDLGVTPTFTRAFAYARSGRALRDLRAAGTPPTGGPVGLNVDTAAAVWATLRPLSRGFAAAAGLLGFAAASLFLHPRVMTLPDPATGWAAVALVTLTAPLGLLALAYGSLAQGLDHIAELRRWEALTGLGALVLQVAALLLGGGLLGVVIAAQLGLAASWLRNRLLVRKVAASVLAAASGRRFCPEVWRVVWPATWRSGVGTLAASGYLQATGLICDQWARHEPAVASAYLLGLRLITAVSQFSQAPFYSRLPRLARLYAAGDRTGLVAQAQRGMRLSHLAFALGAAGLGLFGPWLFEVLGSSTAFPAPIIWWLLVAALFTERMGAMHLQLYSVTNRIWWHVANGVTGLIAVGALLLLLPPLGVLAFPLSYLCGNVLFYTWFSMRLAYREFQMPFRIFEARTSLPAAGLVLAAGLVALAVHR